MLLLYVTYLRVILLLQLTNLLFPVSNIPNVYNNLYLPSYQHVAKLFSFLFNSIPIYYYCLLILLVFSFCFGSLFAFTRAAVHLPLYFALHVPAFLYVLLRRVRSHCRLHLAACRLLHATLRVVTFPAAITLLRSLALTLRACRVTALPLLPLPRITFPYLGSGCLYAFMPGYFRDYLYLALPVPATARTPPCLVLTFTTTARVCYAPTSFSTTHYVLATCVRIFTPFVVVVYVVLPPACLPVCSPFTRLLLRYVFITFYLHRTSFVVSRFTSATGILPLLLLTDGQDWTVWKEGQDRDRTDREGWTDRKADFPTLRYHVTCAAHVTFPSLPLSPPVALVPSFPLRSDVHSTPHLPAVVTPRSCVDRVYLPHHLCCLFYYCDACVMPVYIPPAVNST